MSTLTIMLHLFTSLMVIAKKKTFFCQKQVYGKTPAINSPVRSFVVAILLHHYKDPKIQTVNSLRERTIATNSIPTGWTHILGKNDEFVLCYVDKGRDGSSTQQPSVKTPSQKKYVHKAMRWIGSPCVMEWGFIM